eukprot:GHVN01034112.1.p1 GENE.GHVN01034112.1~~GHVN01034112.1.p1  ORF type:complete len:136 (-),score=12.55 GHVN01034112.1:256-663(-)
MVEKPDKHGKSSQCQQRRDATGSRPRGCCFQPSPSTALVYPTVIGWPTLETPNNPWIKKHQLLAFSSQTAKPNSLCAVEGSKTNDQRARQGPHLMLPHCGQASQPDLLQQEISSDGNSSDPSESFFSARDMSTSA